MLTGLLIGLALGSLVGFGCGTLRKNEAHQRAIFALLDDLDPPPYERRQRSEVYVAALAWGDAEKPRLWS